MRLQDTVTVITGAGSGMGLAMATRFAAEGARVIAGDWNAARLDAAVEDIRRSGGTIVGTPGNIAEQAAAEALIDLAVDTHGRIDVLVNNAGVMDYMQGVGELSDDIWRRVLGINLDGPDVHHAPRRAADGATGWRRDHQHRLGGRYRRQSCWSRLYRSQARAGRADEEHRMDVRETGACEPMQSHPAEQKPTLSRR